MEDHVKAEITHLKNLYNDANAANLGMYHFMNESNNLIAAIRKQPTATWKADLVECLREIATDIPTPGEKNSDDAGNITPAGCKSLIRDQATTALAEIDAIEMKNAVDAELTILNALLNGKAAPKDVADFKERTDYLVGIVRASLPNSPLRQTIVEGLAEITLTDPAQDKKLSDKPSIHPVYMNPVAHRAQMRAKAIDELTRIARDMPKLGHLMASVLGVVTLRALCPEVRMQAITGVSMAGSAPSSHHMLGLIGNTSTDPNMRQLAQHYLMRGATENKDTLKTALSVITKGARDDDENVQKNAVMHLATAVAEPGLLSLDQVSALKPVFERVVAKASNIVTIRMAQQGLTAAEQRLKR